MNTKKFLNLILLGIGIIILGVGYLILLQLLINLIIDSQVENTICINMTIADNIICYIIPIVVMIVLYSVIHFNIKIYKKLLLNRQNILLSIVLILLISLFIYTINNYIVFKDNQIIKNNIFPNLSIVYDYDDIQCVSVGVTENITGDFRLYYVIEFYDGVNVNLTHGVLGDGYDINNIVKVDKLINIHKDIDITDLDKLVCNMSSEYINKYNLLFQQK